jgi:TldD protein
VRLTDTDERVLIATLGGLLLTDRRPSTLLTVQLTAKRGGQTQSNQGSLGARSDLGLYTDQRLKALVDEAVAPPWCSSTRARRRRARCPSCSAAGSAGILLHEAIGHGMEADFNRKGVSVYSDKLGKRIAGDDVTIVDDGTQPHARGAINVDDEGVEGQRTCSWRAASSRPTCTTRISAPTTAWRPRATAAGRASAIRPCRACAAPT